GDGGFIAVGALEPKFYRLLLHGLGLSPDQHPQHDRAKWAETAKRFGEIFLSQPRDHWATLFGKVDACVTPVLTWSEAIDHPHNADRGAFVSIGGIVQPAPAPRFSETRSSIRHQTNATLDEILLDWG